MFPILSAVLALGLPLLALWRGSKKAPRRPYLASVCSFLACLAALLAELFTVKRRVSAGDIGGLEDTIDAVLVICVGLVILTSALNLLLLGSAYGKDTID